MNAAMSTAPMPTLRAPALAWVLLGLLALVVALPGLSDLPPDEHEVLVSDLPRRWFEQ